MGKTSIEWTDHSWPVVNGCRRVSRGCENCYAERLTATRLSQTPKYKGLARFGENGPRWTGKARVWAQHLDMPLKLKKPSRIFVCDMGDLFFEEVPNGVIAAVFGVMAACPQHTFQVLTKRPARARAWFRSIGGPGWAERVCHSEAASLLANGLPHPRDNTWPLANVWLGVSVEDQATADERIPILLDIPAALRFVSAEPLLGPVDLRRWLGAVGGVPGHCIDIDGDWWHWPGACLGAAVNCSGKCCRSGLDWIIVGGESGPGARPFNLAWGRQVVDACAAAYVPCFVKQLGARPVSPGLPDPEDETPDEPLLLRDRKGGDPAEWPDHLRVRQFPTPPPSNLPEKSEAPPPARGKNPADLGGGDTAGIKKGVAADRVSAPAPAKMNANTTMDAIRAALAPGRPLNRGELAQATGRTEKAVASCLTKLRARGAVAVEGGYWTLAAGADDGTGQESAATSGG